MWLVSPRRAGARAMGGAVYVMRCGFGCVVAGLLVFFGGLCLYCYGGVVFVMGSLGRRYAFTCLGIQVNKSYTAKYCRPYRTKGQTTLDEFFYTPRWVNSFMRSNARIFLAGYDKGLPRVGQIQLSSTWLGEYRGVTCRTLCHGCHPGAFSSIIKRRRVAGALGGRLHSNATMRTCLFANAHNANGAAYTGVFTGTIGYAGDVSNSPYLRYSDYGAFLGNRGASVIRVSTTSGGNISGVHRLGRLVAFTPTRSGCHICVVSRIRVLSPNTFGTLLGALRRPPGRMVFVLTAARIRGLPTAVLSHYREFSFEEVSDRGVYRELRFITGRRKLALASSTTTLVTTTTSNNVHSTLSVLSLYTSDDGRVSRDIIRGIYTVTNSSCLLRLYSRVGTHSARGTLLVVRGLRGSSISVSHLLGRVVSRCHSLVVVGAIHNGRGPVIYSRGHLLTLRGRTRGFSVGRVVCALGVLRSTATLVGANSEHYRVRVAIVGLAGPRLSASLTSLRHEVSGLRGNMIGTTTPIIGTRTARRARVIARRGRSVSSSSIVPTPASCSGPGYRGGSSDRILH